MAKYYFYRTTNLTNNKFYYGSGSRENYYGSGKLLKRAIKKYGIENFRIDILKYFDTREKAFEFEDRFLKLYKISEDDNSYNIKDAGIGGNVYKNHPRINEIKNKMSLSQKRKFENPDERAKTNVFFNISDKRRQELSKIWSEGSKGTKNGRFKYNKKVAQIDIQTNEVIAIHDYVRDLDELGYRSKYVINCCNNVKHFNTHSGYKWKWVEDAKLNK